MRPRDWKTLEDQALWLLSNADQAPPREPLYGMALQLRLWKYPRSGMQVSWSIILPAREYKGRGAVIREVSWDRTLDWKRRKAVPEPAVRIRDGKVDWEKLSPFLDEAGGFRLGMAGAAAALPAGTDRAGLEGTRSFAHVRLEWSGRGPRGWGTTIAWFERFRKLLARATKRNRE